MMKNPTKKQILSALKDLGNDPDLIAGNLLGLVGPSPAHCPFT